ncbi:MAG: hypothetical protein WC464_00500 [Bdellovibrionales bacterium]
MKNTSGILLAACLLAASPSMAGNLTFDNGQPQWHTTNCPKPVPPESIMNADPETAGNNMNALLSKYNAYAQDAQTYMNCISNEAAEDQKTIGHTITTGAQDEITAMHDVVEKMYAPLRGSQK